LAWKISYARTVAQGVLEGLINNDWPEPCRISFSQMATTISEMRDSPVVCQNSQGVEVRASLVRLTPYQAVFEIYRPTVVLRSSEVLSNLKIIINDRTAYTGRAVVSNLITTGTGLVCEAKLDESVSSQGFLAGARSNGSFPTRFREFLEQWQKLYRILPDYKVVLADMQTFRAAGHGSGAGALGVWAAAVASLVALFPVCLSHLRQAPRLRG
jgi:hypothetical protein